MFSILIMINLILFFLFLYLSISLHIVILKKRKLMKRAHPFCYLMHNVAHKILVSHTGQLQMYWNVSRDVRDGGHSLQG